MADTRDNAHKAFDVALAKHSTKYAKAMECLKKDRDAMLAFYDFPAEYWTSIRTTNPIESAFATMRLRTAKMRDCGSRDTTLAMVLKLLETAKKRCLVLYIRFDHSSYPLHLIALMALMALMAHMAHMAHMVTMISDSLCRMNSFIKNITKNLIGFSMLAL